MKDLIKISILKDTDEEGKFAYMEYQNGNNPKIYNHVYGCGGYWDLSEVCEAIIKGYEGDLIEVHINI